jgi:hypothetical protein
MLGIMRVRTLGETAFVSEQPTFLGDILHNDAGDGLLVSLINMERTDVAAALD